MILVSLQIFKVIQAVLVLHEYRELVLPILIYEVFLAALQDIVYAFKRYR